jgi:hypothetical protein
MNGIRPVRPSSDPSKPVVVVGAGAAGISCALSAAEAGASVVLLEKSAELGGTVSQALIHTLGGLFDDQGSLLNAGLPAELAERLGEACSYTKQRRIGKTWVLDVDPAKYANVVTHWVASKPNIDIVFHASVTQLSIHAGQIAQITISSNGNVDNVQPAAVVDATGDANVVRLIDAERVENGVALGGVILQLRGVATDALRFPSGVALLMEIRKAAETHQLPPECLTLWVDTGVYPDEAYAKFNVTPDNYDTASMRSAAERLLAFLQTMPAFGKAFINAYGRLGIRDGGRIKGEYCLTEADVKSGKQFADRACRACWPIEHWHPGKGLNLEYLPAGSTYDIPLRSLKVAGFTNLWAAGKCLSAEPRAQASARVVGTCWAMGEAVGKYLGGNWQ